MGQIEVVVAAEELYLEVHTDIVYYRDCFSRMYFLFKPIQGVAYCIELLKVASQIAFQDVLGLGAKYLSAVVWSAGEEKLIRDFYQAGHLSFDSASDFRACLDDLPLTEEDIQKKLSQCAQGMLSRYLRHAMANDSTPDLTLSSAEFTCPDSREKFAGAFHAIMSSSGMCNDDVLQYALTLVKEEAERLLTSSTNFLQTRGGASLAGAECVSRSANASQGIVEAVIKYGDLSLENARIC